MLSPIQSIECYEVLAKALRDILSIMVDFSDNDKLLLKEKFSFDPREFSRLEKLKLLQANFCLQESLERLSTIIEYVPYIFRKYNVNEYK